MQTVIRDNELAVLSEEDTKKVLESDLKPIENIEEYCKKIILENNTPLEGQSIEDAVAKLLPNLMYSDLIEIENELYTRYDVAKLLGINVV